MTFLTSWKGTKIKPKEIKMKFTRTLMMTAAALVLTTGIAAAESASSKNNMGQSDTSYNQDNQPGSPDMNTTSSDMNATSPASGSPDTSASIEGDMSGSVNATAVKAAQASLRDQGFPLSVDGVWGPQTASAIERFQRTNNLPVTGELNTETLAALEIPSR